MSVHIVMAAVMIVMIVPMSVTVRMRVTVAVSMTVLVIVAVLMRSMVVTMVRSVMIVVPVTDVEVSRRNPCADYPCDLDVMVNAQAAERLPQRIHGKARVDEGGQEHVARRARKTIEIDHPCHEAPAACRNEQYTVSVRIR
jgi:hypothetical protein